MIMTALASFVASDPTIQASFGDRVYLNEMPDDSVFDESTLTMSQISDQDVDYLMPIRATVVQVAVHNADFVKACVDSARVEALLNRYRGPIGPEYKATSVSVTGRNPIRAENRWVILTDYRLVWK